MCHSETGWQGAENVHCGILARTSSIPATKEQQFVLPDKITAVRSARPGNKFLINPRRVLAAGLHPSHAQHAAGVVSRWRRHSATSGTLGQVGRRFLSCTTTTSKGTEIVSFQLRASQSYAHKPQQTAAGETQYANTNLVHSLGRPNQQQTTFLL